MRAASAFGWYVFPPIDFTLKWDGTDIFWRTGESQWADASSVVLPGYSSRYRRAVPKSNRVRDPFPFLLARRETGLIQIWPGVLMRTRPGWSTLVRSPANLPRSLGYEVLEGIIETDWWFGPLISTIRLRETGRAISFRTDRPLFQLQPVPVEIYDSEQLNDFSVVRGLSSLRTGDWSRFESTMLPDDVRPGIYAAHVRQRRRESR